MSHGHETMTPEEFLAWEAKQDRKWEFDGFRPVAMNGGTFAHNTIQANLMIALRARLRAGSCRPSGPDMRVAIGGNRYRYPDAMVNCSFVARDALEITDPVVIFEILSDSTARTDETIKFIEYRSIATLKRYVILGQRTAALTVITRVDQIWSIDVLRLEDSLKMPEIDIEIPIRDLYLDVDLVSD